MRNRGQGPGHTRRELTLGVLATTAAWSIAGRAGAEEDGVPVDLQMKLLVKVAGYDKNMPRRAGDKVNVAVVHKADDDVSERVAEQAARALGDHDEIAGLPVSVVSLVFGPAAELKKSIASRKIAIVYFAPGLTRKEVEDVATGLDGVSVLSATYTPTDVPRGVVLGFDVVSGKPKILVNLAQAKKQEVALSADLLKLAKVYE